MARLLSWPVGIHWVSREPLSGPRTRGASSSESGTGNVQTVASPFGLWRWSFSLPPLRHAEARQWRGMVTALHGGANAVRVPFCDPDGLSWAEIGLPRTSDQIRLGTPWSNNQPWSNGRNWRYARPLVAVAAARNRGDSTIKLADTTWGHRADVGVMLGFAPFHLGLYVITQVIGPGEYRIWPPLRKALAVTDFATLDPIMAMRMESESAANLGRGPVHSEGLAITLVEVTDDIARQYFTD